MAGGRRNPASVADAATEGCGIFDKNAGCTGADRALGDDLALASLSRPVMSSASLC